MIFKNCNGLLVSSSRWGLLFVCLYFSPVNLEFMKVVMMVKTWRAGTEEVMSLANNDLNKQA